MREVDIVALDSGGENFGNLLRNLDDKYPVSRLSEKPGKVCYSQVFNSQDQNIGIRGRRLLGQSVDSWIMEHTSGNNGEFNLELARVVKDITGSTPSSTEALLLFYSRAPRTGEYKSEVVGTVIARYYGPVERIGN